MYFEVEFVEEVVGWLAPLHDENRASHLRKDVRGVVASECADGAEEVAGIGGLDERGEPCRLGAVPPDEADGEQPRKSRQSVCAAIVNKRPPADGDRSGEATITDGLDRITLDTRSG